MEYVYKITNPKGLIYIGRTKDLRSRINAYRCLKCKGQIKIYNSLKKYGWERHKFEVILKTTNSENAEVKLIEYYNSFNKGLNLTTGGENPKMSEESKIKSSLNRIGKPSGKKGTKLSQESKELIRKLMIGRPSPNMKPVKQFHKNGEFVKDWDNISIASKTYNILVSSIHNNLKGLSKSAGGFIWQYK